MTNTTPAPYIALALQSNCKAVNNLPSNDQIRDQMNKTISKIGDQISAAKAFINTFDGLPVKLIVLPEYFLTGYPMGESIGLWSKKACVEQHGPEYAALGKLSQDNDLFLSGNTYELDKNFPEIYFQTSFIIGPNGDVILRYRRLISMFAPTPHDVLDQYLDIYGEDSLFPVVDTSIGRLSAVASEEILYPEITRAMALRGAEVICHSSSEIGSTIQTPKNIAKQARAYENMAYVVSANSAGISGTLMPEQSTDGHSKVVDYRGSIIGEAAFGESTTGRGIIDLAALRGARKRPAMTNLLGRQRLEIFSRAYQQKPFYPANNMLKDGKMNAPDRKHFVDTLESTISALVEREII